MAVVLNAKGTSVSSFQIGKAGVTLTADANGYITVADGAATQQPLGYNTIPIYEIDAADVFDLAHAGMMWHKDSGAAVTFTADEVAAIPQGSSWVVHNDDTEDLTIAEGVGVTISLLSSGAPVATGDVTLEQGGIVTVYKYTDTEYWVWGDTNPFDILTAGTSTDATLRWSGSIWAENTNVTATAAGAVVATTFNGVALTAAGAATNYLAEDGSYSVPSVATPTTITVADSSDSTSFPAFFESATGDLGPKTDSQLIYNATSGQLGATTFISTALTNNDVLVAGTGGVIEDSAGLVTFSGTVLSLANSVELRTGSTTGDRIMVYGSGSGGYGMGIEASTFYFKSSSLYRWYSGQNADSGSGDIMELSSAGSLTLGSGVTASGNITNQAANGPFIASKYFEAGVNDGDGYYFEGDSPSDGASYGIWTSLQATGSLGGRLDASSDWNMYFGMGSGTNRGYQFNDGTNGVTFSINPDAVRSKTPFLIKETATAISDQATFGQFWVRNDAPNVALYTDDVGNISTLSNTISEIEYEYDSVVTSTDPGAGVLNFDSVTIGSITTMYIDDLANTEDDSAWWLSNIATGDVLTIRGVADPADYIVASVTSTPTDGTGFWTVPITLIHTGTIFADTDPVRISVQWLSQGGAGTVTSSSAPLINEVAVFTTGTDIAGDANFTWVTADETLNIGSSDRVVIDGNADGGSGGQVRVTKGATASLETAAFYIPTVTGDKYLFGASSTDDSDTFGIQWALSASDGSERVNFTWATHGSTPLSFQNTGGGRVWINDDTVFQNSSLYLLEKAAVTADFATYGQLWIRDDVPNTLMYTDDAGNDFTANNVHEIEYEYDSVVTSTDPGAGVLNFNSVTIGSITTLYIDDTDNTGRDNSFMLSNLADGDVLTIRSASDPADYIVASINGAPTDSTGFWTIAITLIHTGTIFTDADPVRITVQWLSQGGSGTVTSSGSPLSNEVAVFTSGTDIDSDATFTWDGSTLTTADIIATSASANIYLRETGATADEGNWITRADGDIFRISTATDGAATTPVNDVLRAIRTGTTIDQVWLDRGAVITVGGSWYLGERNAAQAEISTYGQYWTLDDVPNTPAFTDDAGNDFVLNNRVEVHYAYSSNTIDSAPPAGTLKFNSVTPGSISELRIDDDDDFADDMAWMLSSLSVGDVIIIRGATDNADYVMAYVDTTPTDETGWWSIPITLINTGTIFTNTDKVRMTVQWMSGAAVRTDGTPSVNEVGFFTDGNTLAGTGSLTWNGSNFEVGGGNSLEVSSGADGMTISHDGTDLNIVYNNTTAINHTNTGTPATGQHTFEGSMYVAAASTALGNISGYGQFRVDSSQGSGDWPAFVMDDGTEWPLHNPFQFTYGFDIATDATNPGTGDVKYDNVTHSSVTNIYINDVNLSGTDMDFVLSNLGDGDILTIRGSFTTSHQVFSVNGTPTDNTGWWTIPVTVVNSTAVPDNNDIADIMVQWFSQAGAGTVTSVSAGDGLDFTTITATGPVTMGTPGSLTSATTNAVTATSHTHEITSVDAVDIASGNLGSGVLPYVTASAANSAFKVVFSDTTGNTSGNRNLQIDDSASALVYNPAGNTLTAGTFVGALSGNATSATTAAAWTTGRTITLTGDVTGTSAAWTGSANISYSTAIAAKAVDIAMLADGTDGELITWSAAGVATTVPVGTSGHVLTSGGTGVAPTFQAAAAGTVTAVTGGVGVDSTGGTTPDLSLDLSELTVATMVTGDWIAFDDAGATRKALISAIPLSIFNDDLGHVENATHTGQVTGATALALDVTAVTAQPASGAIVAADTIIINDGGVLSEATFTQMNTYFDSSLNFAANNDYLRADAADTKTTGILRFNDNIGLTLGTGDDMSLLSTGTDVFFTMNDGSDWTLRGGTSTTEVMINAISNAGVALYHNGIEVATTLGIASGGLEAKNQYNGPTGSTRVLTSSDKSYGTPNALYAFDTGTTNADPGAGRLRLNNATPASVTALYVDDLSDGTDATAKDMEGILGVLTTNDIIHISMDEDGVGSGYIFKVSGTLTDNTGWWTIPVTVLWANNDVTPNNSELIVFKAELVSQGGGTGTVTSSGSPLNNEVAVFATATDINSDSTFTWDGTTLSAGTIRAYDGGGTDYVQLSDTGTTATISTNANDLLISAQGGISNVRIDNGSNLHLRNAADLVIYDNSNVGNVTFDHDATDFNITGSSTTDINITGITAIAAGTVDADFDAITGTSYGGITEANLVDKTATETISAAWDFTTPFTVSTNAASTTTVLFDNDSTADGSEHRLVMNSGDASSRWWVQTTNNTGTTITGGPTGRHTSISTLDATHPISIGTSNTERMRIEDALITFNEPILTVASATGDAGFNIPTGTAPSSPAQGDMWVTATDALIRINGVSESIIGGGGGIPTQITVADSTDTTSFPAFFESATGDLGPKTDASNYTYNATTGALTAVTFVGALTGNAATATTATDATNVTVTTSTAASAFKIPFANTTASTTAEYGLLQDSTATFTYNPSANVLTVGTIVTSGDIIVNSGDIDVDQDRKFFSTGFEIYNTTSDLVINNTNTANNADIFIQTHDGESAIVCRGRTSDSGAVELYHSNDIRFQTAAITTADGGTGADVHDGLGNFQPVGFNTMPVYEIDASDTFDLAHVGMVWHKDANAGVTFTWNNDTNIPVGAMYMVHNDDTEDLTIAEGTGTIEFLFPGAAPVGGNVTVEQGGIVTVYKYTDAIAWVWGAPNASAASTPTVITVADESADTTCFPSFFTAATGDLGPKTGTNLTFNSSTGDLSATLIAGITAANLVDKAATEAITGTWTLDGTVSTSDYGTGGRVKDGTDVARPIGFNTIPVYEIDAADAFDLAHNGMMWHKDANAAVTFTCNNDTTIPQGATYMVHNDDTENLTIAEGTATIEFLSPGAAPVGGDVTVEQGGIVTVYKYSDAIFWVWGSKAPQVATDVTVADESADTTCFPLFVTAATGDLPPKSGTNLTFNSSTGSLSSTLLTTLGDHILTGGSVFVNDSESHWVGSGNDARFYFNATNTLIDCTGAANNFFLRVNGSETALLARPNAEIELYHNGIVKFETHLSGAKVTNSMYFDETTAAGADLAGDGQIWVRSNAPNDLYFTNDVGVDYPVGYATYRKSSINVIDNINQTLNMTTDTVADAMVGGAWINTSASTSYTLTLEPSTDTQFPVGSQIAIYNRSTSGTMTVTEGSGTTMYVLDGSSSTDSAGSSVIAAGGYATLIRESTTIYVLMGAGITP